MKTLALMVVLGGTLAAAQISSAQNIAPPARGTGDKPASVPPPTDGYLLRDGLNQSSHPQPATIIVLKPIPTPAPVRGRGVAQQKPPDNVRSQKRQTVRTREPIPERTAVRRIAEQRRSPVVSFIYWWNGWVLRTFHTKVGTVLLGTVGAKP